MDRKAINHYVMITIIVYIVQSSPTTCHVQVVDPLPRGQLRGTKRAPSIKAIDRLAPTDSYAFFPAGDKNARRGSGKRSQERAVKNWSNFEPTKRGFQWRAGICSDEKSSWKQDHKRGGKYYNNGMISKSYIAGSIIDIKLSMNENHNGYFEFHICNVEKCGGEISEQCFYNGACRKLERAWNVLCDEQKNRLCGPIDRSNKGRWYVPCAVNADKGARLDNYGFRNEVRYKLPDGFTCAHCVLHFYYTSANNCNPPGVVQYFKGPDKPSWGTCKGQAGAVGQLAESSDCGGRTFPEEYYSCSDIRITARNSPRQNPIDKIEFGQIFGNSFDPKALLTEKTRNIKILKYGRYTIRVTLKWPVTKISYTTKAGEAEFENDAVPIAPFYVFGFRNNVPMAWSNPYLNNVFTVTINADGFKKIVRLTLFK